MSEILIRVFDSESSEGRQVGWGRPRLESVKDRMADLRRGILEGIQAVTVDLDKIPAGEGWAAAEFSASFGVSLAAETALILAKSSAEATFNVTVTFRRA